jgi:uncharacterized protein (UPF0264 family)
MTGLLVSVRSAVEAAEALAGGADLIDVKEPARGSLGRADNAVLADVVAAVAGRRPVSAALGELVDADLSVPEGCAFVKWGLAGAGRNWPARWEEAFRRSAGRAVVVAYADWQCAAAPALDEVVAFARRRPGSVLLVDTHCKDPNPQGRRPTLLDWLPLPWLADLVATCHASEVRVALAGSLGPADVEQVRQLRPDWIAVRAAACARSERHGSVCRDQVRCLKELVDRCS